MRRRIALCRYPAETCVRSVPRPTKDKEYIGNRILLALPLQDFNRLHGHLRFVELRPGEVLCSPDSPGLNVHFINRGLVSLIKRMRNGDAVEIGVRGIEGVTEPEFFLGLDTPLFESVVQLPGSAFSIAKSTLQHHLHQSRSLKALMTAYAGTAVRHIAQISACNRLHVLEQRICRWLLTADDNALGTALPINQGTLAATLGVHRPGVSIALTRLQTAGLVKYAKGHVTIIDRDEIEALACECYRSMRADFDAMFPKRSRIAL